MHAQTLVLERTHVYALRACNCAAAKMPPLDMQIVRVYMNCRMPQGPLQSFSPTTPETRQYFINPFDRTITEGHINLMLGYSICL